MAPYHVKLTASKLHNIDIVEAATITPTTLVVDFVTGVREWFCYSGKPKCGSWHVTEKELRLELPELSKIPGASNSWIIPRSLLVGSSILDQRLLVHRMVSRMSSSGDVVIPGRILGEITEQFLKIDPATADHKSHYEFIVWKRSSWAPLWTHYFSGSVNSGQLVKHIDGEILGNHKDISSIEVLFQIGRSYGNPVGYASLFQTLGVKSVLDLHPDGGKILGCALAGVTYSGLPTPTLDKALNQGIVESLGLSYEPYSDDLLVDLVICDHSLSKFNLDDVRPYAKHARESRWKIMAWCPPEKAIELSKATGRSRPRLVPIRLSKSKPTSYLTIW